MIHNSGVVFGVELNKNLEAHHIYVEDVTELKRFRNRKQAIELEVCMCPAF